LGLWIPDRADELAESVELQRRPERWKSRFVVNHESGRLPITNRDGVGRALCSAHRVWRRREPAAPTGLLRRATASIAQKTRRDELEKA
jgi:hypothetical protein